MAIAFNKLFAAGKLKDFPIKKLVAAVPPESIRANRS